MNLEELNVQLSYPMIITGLCAAGIGMVWLLIRLFRRGRPLLRRIAVPVGLVLIGVIIAAAPPVIGRFVPIDLGPRDKIVNGERHLTLSGWDRKDYTCLRQKTDAALLQMANADVTDEVVGLITDFKNLRELDISDSKITDRALEQIARLSTLETVYLNRTSVTGTGVEKHLTKHPTLKVIWLRGTSVSKDAADAVKAGKPGRKVFVD